MKGTATFYINGKKLVLPLYEKGDRVKVKDGGFATESVASGTVESVSDGGLFIDVSWDYKSYPSILGGRVELGKSWIVSSLELIS
ncbi:hypothetical protein NDS46_30155 (plasmid) [Paenibacillus thiaminolyticus]|uniref:hypothetical protein n=1 Tax=Paenibacillus thiaminolyticus TaxID=49283 RepID=UPI0023312640|nr:hypothetical protein [Paenibacillus thiaminolyticus]WCF11611.1 hypothetical protein NDS46_30155 [Paenibacillus thiaminolyticus]